ncbi:hypothetical protein RBB84_12355 [Rhodococcus sp. D-6]|uniref:Uncharacterized protein n=1 Tax=Rhodococcus sp. D-6 TaxID=1387842 RepID=A0AAU7V3Q4_9NOCA
MDLDVLNVNQVSGHSVIDADLGIGGRRLMVLSGIAIPFWSVDSDELHQTDCRVNLRVQAGNVESATIHVGLASIRNDDSSWVFASDVARWEVNAAGELILIVHLALLGEPSSLYRFSYQVVLTTRVVTTEISGKIRWKPGVFTPPGSALTASAIGPLLRVTLNERTVTKFAGSSTTFAYENETLKPIGAGEIVNVRLTDGEYLADYRISGCPKGIELKVTVEPVGFPPGVKYVTFPEQNGGDVVNLSVANPSRTNVDFRVDVYRGPK